MEPGLDLVEVASKIHDMDGTVLLHSSSLAGARHSFLAARPFLTFRSFGSRIELGHREGGGSTTFGNPWVVLDHFMSRFEMVEEIDHPFPLGGCFGVWGYELKNFVEPRLTRSAVNDLDLPDCSVSFCDSLLVSDRQLGKTWLVSTGLRADGSRSQAEAVAARDWWMRLIERSHSAESARDRPRSLGVAPEVESNLTREAFVAAVAQAQRWIRSGDIYQVNLAQRLRTAWTESPWAFYERLTARSPAPFSGYMRDPSFALASSSPECFLRMSGSHVVTRPIKGTRPRSSDPIRDAQLAYELQTSPKELSELVMITDLLRNDLGRVAEYGTVSVPELARLERHPHVHHLVSTVEARLKTGQTHFGAFAKCFPGGSVTGAPKIRAMQIIEALEPCSRGLYTGSMGYLGFNQESQLNILIRSGVATAGTLHFHVGAGIVADSIPEAEYEETLAKAGGFMDALRGEGCAIAPMGGTGGRAR